MADNCEACNRNMIEAGKCLWCGYERDTSVGSFKTYKEWIAAGCPTNVKVSGVKIAGLGLMPIKPPGPKVAPLAKQQTSVYHLQPGDIIEFVGAGGAVKRELYMYPIKTGVSHVFTNVKKTKA